MAADPLRQLLDRVAAGDLSPAAACQALAGLDVLELAEDRLDLGRERRCGFPEVIYGESKTPDQVLAIVQALYEAGRSSFVTRLQPAAATALGAAFPAVEVDAVARTATLWCGPPPRRPGRVGVITAGSSDRPVAAEAAATLRFFGLDPLLITDVGVAGLHRLLARLTDLRAQQVLIVVAGMEGALPSVVGGLVAMPVIAVPTAVGYGAGLGGFTALMGMLSSCASGLTVVNIDNGFGAACAANRILRAAAGDGP